MKNTKKLIMRIANASDRLVLEAIQKELFPDESDYAYEAYFNPENVKEKYTFTREYIFYDNSSTIGYSQVGIIGLYSNNKDEVWIDWFGVREPFRRKGYAKEMLSEIIAIAKNNGFQTLRLFTNSEVNKEACSLYEKIGFLGEPNTKCYNGLGRVYSMSLNHGAFSSWGNVSPLGWDETIIESK